VYELRIFEKLSQNAKKSGSGTDFGWLAQFQHIQAEHVANTPCYRLFLSTVFLLDTTRESSVILHFILQLRLATQCCTAYSTCRATQLSPKGLSIVKVAFSGQCDAGPTPQETLSQCGTSIALA
jgi:hypothetical protein